MSHKEKVLVSRTIAVPADTNPWGDIFGGWILSLMDIAAGSIAARLARGSVATKAISNVSFDIPIFVGDEVSVYAEIDKIGNTSMTLTVYVTIKRKGQDEEMDAVKGSFVMVALDENRRPRSVRQKWPTSGQIV
ncbi:MAG: acyl-CoA thioesterase [Holosporaceae bacterium]|jgi:acyl-CoA thioesterase YciA|nr:acyl-CoA thioesterase [Holosporaceae bacterium]